MDTNILSELLDQESKLQLSQFNHAIAGELGCSLKSAAEELSVA